MEKVIMEIEGCWNNFGIHDEQRIFAWHESGQHSILFVSRGLNQRKIEESNHYRKYISMPPISSFVRITPDGNNPPYRGPANLPRGYFYRGIPEWAKKEFIKTKSCSQKNKNELISYAA